jgi:hypothetical protein
MHQYLWGPEDTLLWVAARFYQDAGWPDPLTMMGQIVAANYPLVIDWQADLSGIVITLPYRT